MWILDLDRNIFRPRFMANGISIRKTSSVPARSGSVLKVGWVRVKVGYGHVIMTQTYAQPHRHQDQELPLKVFAAPNPAMPQPEAIGWQAKGHPSRHIIG